ncbi:MAG: TonB-dependent receptor [Acidobacteriota bacterium]|nr:TonB-dependent receptor [Acidobacteriota bacterium]
MTLVSRASMLLIVGCLLSVFTSTLSAQEFRATVNGRVTDASGAAVPGVTITALNPGTNETATAVTNDEGNYTIPFLQPGTYRITAEQTGFKKTALEQVLQVGQTATANLQLQVGDVAEVVTVTADAGLDSAKADRGQVIDNMRVSELPLNARNPFMLSTLTAGITYNGPAIYQRPFDNGAIADWSINGGQNRNNEFLLDGAPNNSIQGGNNIAYVPPVDSVQEFKIVTNGYDAQYGRSAGGTVNVTTKSGGNEFHGTVYEFARRKWLDANYLQFNAQRPTPQRPEGGQDRPEHFLDQYGFFISGPVMFPRFGVGGRQPGYDGRNRTFFSFNYEGYREGTPNPGTFTYPDEAQRRGDFSNLRDGNGRLILIYEPNSGANGRVRTPISCNGRINVICPERVNPVAQGLLNYYPLPNRVSTNGFRDNYFFAPNVARDDFKNYIFKIDQNIGSDNKVFFRYGYNKRVESRVSNGIVGNAAEDSQGPLERINYTGVADWVSTLSPTAIINVRVSANRYIESARTEIALGFDPATLGFPASYASNIPIKMFPRFNFADYQNLGRGGFNREPTNTYSVQPNMTLILGNHTTRFGGDIRFTQYAQQFSGRGAGEFNFNRNLTRFNFDNDNSNPNVPSGVGPVADISGNSIASLLLGAPNNVFVENQLFPIYMWKYVAPWVQDDWKVSQNLTLNLGLRWDLNGPPKERYNRANFGFDPTAVNPVSARLAGGTQVRGGIGFVDINGNPETPYRYDKNNLQPRFGAAYQVNEKTVVRGGFGQYFLNPTTVSERLGFQSRSNATVSQAGGQTSLFNFSNPFPTGLIAPSGSTGGLETFLGQGFNYLNPNFKLPHVWQYSLSIQRQLPFGANVEISYVGSRTYNEQTPGPGGTQNQNIALGINEPSPQFLNQCDPTKGGNPDFCNQQIANPFFQVRGFEGTNRFTNSTLSRFELARPFPQFAGINEIARNDGRIWYDSLQVTANKRPTRGFSLYGTYTFSKMIEQNGYIDSARRTMNRSPYFADRPHRFTASGVWELPVGKGQYFLGNASKVVDMLFGGIEFAGTYIFQSGQPWELPGNVEYVKDAQNPDPEQFRGLNNRFDPSNFILGATPCVGRRQNNGTTILTTDSLALGCTEPNFIIRAPFEERRTGYRVGQLRRQSYQQFDMNFAKSIRFGEVTRLQLRAEFFNVTNTPMYDERQYNNDPTNAEFGRVNLTTVRQSNFPRQIQLAAKFIF